MKRLVWIVLLSLLVACGGETTEGVPTESADSISQVDPTNTPIPPTETPEPTATATDIPPTETPQPTETPESAEGVEETPTDIPPTPTLTPTPSPTPIMLRTQWDFTDRNPFTGETFAEPENQNRRPILCKISNTNSKYVRPQSGLNSADIVFEHLAESNITRLTGLYYGKTPTRVHPIRSARLIDTQLPAMYDAALCFSGTSTGIHYRFIEEDFSDRIFFQAWGVGYERVDDQGGAVPEEHTMYGDLPAMWDYMEDRAFNTPPEITTYQAFTDTPPPNGKSVNYFSIDYDYTFVEWRWDETAQKYRRWSDDVLTIDKADGQPVTASNVVVLFAVHQRDPSICADPTDEECLLGSTNIFVGGIGDAILFRDGQMYEGNWHRKERSDMFTFKTTSGAELPLQIGQTWIQIVPVYWGLAALDIQQ